MYGDVPFLIETLGEEANIAGVKLHITPISDKQYLLVAKDEIVVKGKKTPIEIDQICDFDTPLSSEHFNFILRKNKLNPPQEDKLYFLQFNALGELTFAFKNALSVSQSNKKADGISLTLKGINRQQQADYINELVNVYMDYGLNQKNKTVENTVRFIDLQLGHLVDSLDRTAQRFSDFRSSKGTVDLSQEALIVVEKLGVLETEMALSKRRLEYYRNLKQYMGNMDQMKMVVAPSIIGIADPVLNAQVVRLSELYSKKSSLSYVAKENNPGILMLERDIQATVQSLSGNLKNLIDYAQADVESLSKRMQVISGALAGLPKTEQELINIKRSFDLNNDLYTFLLQKRAEAAISAASNVSDAQILDPARAETAIKVGPKTMINLLSGLILGLVIPFLVIVLKDYFDETIHTREDVEKQSKLPIVGEIGINTYENEIPVAEHVQSRIAETFRGLRVNLEYLYKSKGPKVIAIHSLLSGEGKTFISTNLSAIMAANNKKVLLIGCDLRKPRLHEVFEQNSPEGLSTYLIGNNTFNEIVHTTHIPNFSYVHAGPIPPNPSELIDNGKFHVLLEEAKKQYDFIILDNAPVGLVTDGLIVGTHADINLFIFRQGKSNKKQVKHIDEIANKAAFHQVGFVLNNVEYKRYGSSYGGYGKYEKNGGYYYDEKQKVGWFKRAFLGIF